MASFVLGAIAFVAMVAAFVAGALTLALVALGLWLLFVLLPLVLGALHRPSRRPERRETEDPS